MDKVDKIFVPTDFSICAGEALSYGVFLARQLKATILLAHVMDPTIYPYLSTLSHPFGYAALKMGQKMDRLARTWRGSGVPIETHLFRGAPAVEIVNAARSLECDLIVMGTNGRRGVARVLMGSVAESVIRTAPLPVLTIRRWREAARETEMTLEREIAKAGQAA